MQKEEQDPRGTDCTEEYREKSRAQLFKIDELNGSDTRVDGRIWRSSPSLPTRAASKVSADARRGSGKAEEFQMRGVATRAVKASKLQASFANRPRRATRREGKA